MNETSEKKTAPKPRPEDVSSPDAIIKAMYETISGPAGKRNWYRERSLFLEGARLIPIGKRVHKEGKLQVLSLEEWIEDAEPFLAENDFYEVEIMRQMNRFGNLLQAFSTYEARNSPDGAPIARGINSIQLLFKDSRWWIVTIMWDNESKDNPIPEEFLPYLW
ncbi:hypothetical protein ACFL07_03950 [Pseudomonadota bacterium]|jgi:hypothetical protein